jgi:sigma-B regulation protein RsbU (phosphoserine phosphatase)
MKWVIVSLLVVIVWLVASSIYIYDIRHPEHVTAEHNHAPRFQNLAVDVRHSFLGADPDQVVCFRESHRNFYIFTFYLLSTIVGLIGLGMFNQFRNNKKLARKNEEIRSQQVVIEEANEKIVSSIRYASRIQQSYLPGLELIRKYFPDFFLLYQPKDVVSGDFYYFRDLGDTLALALGDCTGHGVPGAFLTINSISLLDSFLPQRSENPAEVLALMEDTFKERVTNPDVPAGLDIGLVLYKKKENRLIFSGAHHSLYLLKQGILEEIKGTRKGIVGEERQVEIRFENQEISLEGVDALVMFSDGLTDQFGGPGNKKIGKKQARQWIENQAKNGRFENGYVLADRFFDWKGTVPQTDDVSLMVIPLS